MELGVREGEEGPDPLPTLTGVLALAGAPSGSCIVGRPHVPS